MRVVIIDRSFYESVFINSLNYPIARFVILVIIVFDGGNVFVIITIIKITITLYSIV